MTVIQLTHIDRGPMKVAIAEEHTDMLDRRVWTDVNSDGLVYEDEAFEESPEEIDRIFAEATADAERDAEEFHYETAAMENYCRAQPEE